jgi:multidrug efflux pump subunit AcrA (membrane-fusion protein)
MSKKIQLITASIVFLVLFALWLGWRHGKTEADDAEHADKAHGGIVAAVVKASRGKLGAPLTLAGAFKPFQDVDVHAKVAGYIKKIYVDVGSRVTEGQTLAVLEVPELAAQLAGADAAVRRSRQEISRAQGDVERASRLTRPCMPCVSACSKPPSRRQDWWPNRNWTTRERRISRGKHKCPAQKQH